MATVTGLTAERMLAIEGASVIDGEVLADHLILTKFDGTQIDAGNVVGPTGPTGPQGDPGTTDPWVLSADTWTFGAADAPTYTMTTPGDKTASIGVGQRVRLTHSAAVKYFIVTAVTYAGGNTTVTLYGGTDYTLSASAITLVSFSVAKAPIGFPLSREKWSVTIVDTADHAQATATGNTWYYSGISIVVPIGSWILSWSAGVSVNTADRIQAGLSTANNTAPDTELCSSNREGSGAVDMERQTYREKVVVLAAKATYYMNMCCRTNSGSTIRIQGSNGAATVLRAVCAYL
jgi:hypothetical protein